MSFSYRREYRGSIRLVAFDWAGTIVDFGCQAPTLAFVELFREAGLDITLEQARGPMGIGKREHIEKLLQMAEIADAWEGARGSRPTPADGDDLYEQFHEIQVRAALKRTEFIPGALETFDWLRGRGAMIATNTGYFREVLDAILPVAQEQGLVSDSNVCASDVPEARPAPWMLVVNMLETGVYPAEAVVKVGDTVPDVEEALNAGAWTVGVIESGNGIGLLPEEIERLGEDDLARRVEKARDELQRAGAHFTVPTVADLPPIIEEIEFRLMRGERP